MSGLNRPCNLFITYVKAEWEASAYSEVVTLSILMSRLMFVFYTHLRYRVTAYQDSQTDREMKYGLFETVVYNVCVEINLHYELDSSYRTGL